MTTTCVILAGGLGTRLRSVLQDAPKCLAPVNGQSFLERQMRSLSQRGVGRFVLALGHGASQVEASVAQWAHGLQVDCVTEPLALGTGGAIRHAMTALHFDEALVANGDTFLGGGLQAMLKPLDRGASECVRMAVVQVADRQRYGGVAWSPDQRVTHFIEKGQHGAGPINAGLYRVHTAAFDAADGLAFSFETVVLPRLAQNGALLACPIAGPFIDIGIPVDYQSFVERHGEFAARH